MPGGKPGRCDARSVPCCQVFVCDPTVLAQAEHCIVIPSPAYDTPRGATMDGRTSDLGKAINLQAQAVATDLNAPAKTTPDAYRPWDAGRMHRELCEPHPCRRRRRALI